LGISDGEVDPFSKKAIFIGVRVETEADLLRISAKLTLRF
jgi:hypothetical protein